MAGPPDRRSANPTDPCISPYETESSEAAALRVGNILTVAFNCESRKGETTRFTITFRACVAILLSAKQAPLPPGETEPASCRLTLSGRREIAEHVVQDAAVAIILEFLERIDPANHRHWLGDTV